MARFNEQYLKFGVLVSAKGDLDLIPMLEAFERLIKNYQIDNGEVKFIYHQCVVESERIK
jgi:hypothetical protein